MASATSYAQAYIEVTASLDAHQRLAWLLVFGVRTAQRQIRRMLQQPDATVALHDAGVPDSIARFLIVLAEDGKVGQIDAIRTRALQLVIDDKLGTPATISTRSSMDEQTRQLVVEQLRTFLPEPVVLGHRQDQSILGGYTLMLGSQLIDQTVNARLAALRAHVTAH